MYKSYCKDLALKGHTGKMCADKSKEVEELYNKLQHTSLLKKHLTPAIYNKLKDKKTKAGGTLADCIRSGCLNLESGVGLYACDEEAYTVFEDLFDAVIKDYHKVKNVEHPTPKFSGDSEFEDLDPEGKFVISTRVRVGRSHEGYPFPPLCNKDKKLEMEKITKAALQKLDGDLKGTYYPLTGMDKSVEKKLVEDHFLFKDDDRFLRAAGGYNDWPAGRGIFHNDKKSFLVWVNEEDHLRFISMQMGGNLKEVYGRLVRGIDSLSKSLKFAKTDKLGFLTFCPTNLGTTMRASVHIKIPLLSADTKNFHEFCSEHNLQPRGIHGEHTESKGGVFDISNKRRLGLTEYDALKEMENGIKAIIAKEKQLQASSTQQAKK